MAKVTLATILQEIKRLDAKNENEFKKRDSLSDVRFEFLKEQMQSTHAELREFKSEMRTEFTFVHKDLKVIRDQTAHITERVASLEHSNNEAAPS
jgi:chaperonin cofactor prefoldin